MIDTTDLPSYYPGYDEYCEPKIAQEKYDYSDEYHEEVLLRKELKKMERKVIDLRSTNMTFEEVINLKNYVWKNDKLIPVDGE